MMFKKVLDIALLGLICFCIFCMLVGFTVIWKGLLLWWDTDLIISGAVVAATCMAGYLLLSCFRQGKQIFFANLRLYLECCLMMAVLAFVYSFCEDEHIEWGAILSMLAALGVFYTVPKGDIKINISKQTT
jgi:hypothetical protein